MAMKDLGKKSEMYDSPLSSSSQKKVYYPSLSLPLLVVKDKNLTLDDKVEIKLIGKIVSLDNRYGKEVTFELQEGEVITTKKKKEKSVLEGA